MLLEITKFVLSGVSVSPGPYLLIDAAQPMAYTNIDDINNAVNSMFARFIADHFSFPNA